MKISLAPTKQEKVFSNSQLIKYDLCTIDPGIHVGWCAFTDGVVQRHGSFSVKSKDPVMRCREVQSMTRAIIPPAKVYLVEGVEVYQGAVSQAAAIRGDLVGLAYMVMSIALVLDGDVQVISPRWKGQLPYDALRKWCVKLVGINAPNDHVAAAIGMGLDHYGKL